MGDRRLGIGMVNVPHLDAAFATRINKFGRRGNGNSADDLAVGEGVNLTSMAGNASGIESIRWKMHRIHLVLCCYMK